MVLYPEAPPPPGIVLSALFWKSAPFVNAVREDVTTLLDLFVSTWEKDRQGEESIFQCFKRLWKSTGWCHAHCVVVEPSLRKDWWDTVTHCFTEHINITKPADTHQIGTLFALYILEFTQPSIEFISALPIKLTIPTIKHILTFHEVLQHRPSALDIQWIISQLLSSEHSYTYIVPDNVKDYPPLPTNRAINRTQSLDAQEEISTLVSSIKQEIDTQPDLTLQSKEAYTRSKGFLTSNTIAKSLLIEASRKAKEDLASQQAVEEGQGLSKEGSEAIAKYLKQVQETEVGIVRGSKGLFGLVQEQKEVEAQAAAQAEEQVVRLLAGGRQIGQTRSAAGSSGTSS